MKLSQTTRARKMRKLRRTESGEDKYIRTIKKKIAELKYMIWNSTSKSLKTQCEIDLKLLYFDLNESGLIEKLSPHYLKALKQ